MELHLFADIRRCALEPFRISRHRAPVTSTYLCAVGTKSHRPRIIFSVAFQPK